jgi:branched-chain amino acid transport system ATP-binding protein
MSAVLAIDHVQVRFGGVIAVRDVSLEVNAGERIGLIGPNGAGKTSLVNCVAGEIRPTTGSVHLNGIDVTRTPPHRRFQHGLSRTFQVAHPFPGLSVLESVVLGPLARGQSVADAQDKAVDAIALLGLAASAEREMRELNPVTAKLVELARIIAAGSEIVLLDELLAGLLPTERTYVLDTLLEMSAAHGWATVMIEHLIADVRRFCERLAVLVDGELIADGPTDAVLADPRVISAYLGTRDESHDSHDPSRADHRDEPTEARA